MKSVAVEPALKLFEGLKSYSKADVGLLNCFARLCSPETDWRTWIQDGLGSLVDVPSGSAIKLKQENQIEAGEPETLTFDKAEVRIGREADNDIVIALPGVGRQHARLVQHGEKYLLEDLGSANGTYLNDSKLAAHEPVTLVQDSRFLIFPYEFTFSLQKNWRRQGALRISASAARAAVWGGSGVAEYSGFQFFQIKVHPAVGTAILALSSSFLKALVERVTHGTVGQLVASDAGLVEFLLLSVLERANRDLRFPFHFSLAPLEKWPQDVFGITVECAIGLTGIVGMAELFLPAELVREIQGLQPVEQTPSVPVAWPVFATSGYADLRLNEFTELEPGDILLLQPAPALLLPGGRLAGDLGWNARLVSAEPERLILDDYFERNPIMESTTPSAEQNNRPTKPDFAQLPVRVHVVLSQLEMTLADLNSLGPGSILELDRQKHEPVQLAVNGQLAGTGDLVDVDGKLGVRILNWITK